MNFFIAAAFLFAAFILLSTLPLALCNPRRTEDQDREAILRLLAELLCGGLGLWFARWFS